MRTFIKNLLTAGAFLLLVFGINSLPSCSKAQSTVHDAVVLENGEHTFVYGTAHTGDSVWVNLDTHEVDNTTEDVMLCIIN